jgi:PAS domain-containing protein
VITGPHIDYAAVYRQLPVPVVLVTPDFEIADVNVAFLQMAGRPREDLLGRNVLDAIPEHLPDPGTTGVRSSAAPLRRVLATGEADPLELHKYDIEASPGMSASRYWSGVNAPVRGPDAWC